MLRSFFVAFLFLGLPYCASAQDLCTTVIDLTRLYSTLQTVGEQRGKATAAQIIDMRAVTLRYDATLVNYTIENSPLASQKALINAAFERAGAILTDLATHHSRSTLATLPSTGASFHRALAVLGRVDCQPPIGIPPAPAAQTALPRTSDAVTPGIGIGPIGVLKWLPVSIALFSFAALCGLVFHLHQRRVESLRRRYNCNLESILILTGSTTKFGTGRVVDISRSGVKVRPDGASCPQNGDRVSLSIDGTQFPMRVRWQNAHYFGATFEQFLSERGLRGLIGTKAQKIKRKKPPRASKRPKTESQNTGQSI